MIIDSLHNAAKYYSLHPNFKTAFDYVSQNDISKLEPGAFEITEGLKIIVITGDATRRKH